MGSAVIAVDTSALISVLIGEPEREVFLEVLRRNEPVLPATCLVEISMVLNSRNPDLDAAFLDEFLASFKIGIASITPELARAARDAFLTFGKGRHPAGLNFGDCFSYALAKQLDASLLFKGADFGLTDVRIAKLEADQT